MNRSMQLMLFIMSVASSNLLSLEISSSNDPYVEWLSSMSGVGIRDPYVDWLSEMRNVDPSAYDREKFIAEQFSLWKKHNALKVAALISHFEKCNALLQEQIAAEERILIEVSAQHALRAVDEAPNYTVGIFRVMGIEAIEQFMQKHDIDKVPKYRVELRLKLADEYRTLRIAEKYPEAEKLYSLVLADPLATSDQSSDVNRRLTDIRERLSKIQARNQKIITTDC